jgi:hypothetical protein
MINLEKKPLPNKITTRNPEPQKQEPTEKVITLESDMIGYHGSDNQNLKLQDIRVFSPNAKQGKKYGGFYMAREQDLQHAIGYANMSGGHGTVYTVKIKAGSKMRCISGDVTRLTKEYIDKATSDGIGSIMGKDPRGRTEVAIIHLSVIKSIEIKEHTKRTNENIESILAWMNV